MEWIAVQTITEGWLEDFARVLLRRSRPPSRKSLKKYARRLIFFQLRAKASASTPPSSDSDRPSTPSPPASPHTSARQPDRPGGVARVQRAAARAAAEPPVPDDSALPTATPFAETPLAEPIQRPGRWASPAVENDTRHADGTTVRQCIDLRAYNRAVASAEAPPPQPRVSGLVHALAEAGASNAFTRGTEPAPARRSRSASPLERPPRASASQRRSARRAATLDRATHLYAANSGFWRPCRVVRSTLREGHPTARVVFFRCNNEVWVATRRLVDLTEEPSAARLLDTRADLGLYRPGEGPRKNERRKDKDARANG